MRDVSKLPRWAQQLIHNLEHENAELRRHQQLPGPERSDTYVEDNVPVFGVRHPLPEGARVLFLYGDRHDHNFRAYIDESGALHVTTQEAVLGVYPQHANAVVLRAVDYQTGKPRQCTRQATLRRAAHTHGSSTA